MRRLWQVMDDSGERRDWLQDVYDLYTARAAERREEWAAVEQARFEGTGTSLALDADLGDYRSDILGDVVFARQGSNLVLRTGMYDYEVSHWHLDTVLVDYLTLSHGQFMTFAIDGEGAVAGMTVFGHEFQRQ